MLKVKFVDGAEDIRPQTMEILKRHFGDVQECDDPDFLFYGPFTHEHLKFDCVRIMWTGENLRPDFNICDYAVGFDRMDFPDRYVRIPLYYFYQEDYKIAREKHLHVDENAAKRKFCNFVYSNQNAPQREEMFRLLSAYKQVDSGGRFMNNIGGPVADKIAFQSGYKFTIAFENSSTPGYATEKILHAFSAGTVPIYWGDPEIAKDFNDKAFINCHAYGSLEEVVQKVIEIDQDDALYEQMLREPIGTPEQFPENPIEKWEEFVVHICSQTPGAAIRRNNLVIGKDYQEDMKWMRADLERYHKSIVRRLWNKIR